MRATRGAYRGAVWGVLAVLSLAGAAGLLVLRDAGPLHGTPLADILATVLGALSVGIGLYGVGFTLRAERSDHARRLADLKNQVDRRLIAAPRGYFPGSGNVISVGFKDSATPDTPVSEPLGDYFTSPRCQARLVILGDPGSGKTVAATQLMAHLMDAWKEGDPVPVRIPLSTWNTERPLLDWLSGHLKDMGLVPSRTVARELLDARLVLPIFDGLDEMDPPDVPARGTRALRALERLNTEYDGRTGRARMVVVCRTDRYAALRRKVKLGHATTVTLQPLSSDQQLAFLRESGLQDETGQWLPEWGRVAEALTWTGTPRGLAGVLDTPWRMALLTTAYTERDEEDFRPLRLPGALLAMPLSAVPDHLLGLYTHAAASTRNRQPDAGRRRDPARVEEWLTVLARHLRDDSRSDDSDGTPGADDEVVSDTDLVLHRLWRMEKDPQMGHFELLLLTLPFVISLTLAGLLGIGAWLDSPFLPYAAGGTLVLMTSALPRALANTELQPVPHRLDWQRLRRRYAVMSAVLYTIGAVLYVWDLHDRPLLFAAVVAGYMVSLVTGLAVWPVADHPQATLTGPRDPLRAELRYALVWATAISLFVGAVLARGMGTGLGFAYGAVLTALPAFTVAAKAWRRYAAFKIATAGRFPADLGAFLDWCVEAGIMRVEGFAYQFRHRELQDWMAGRP